MDSARVKVRGVGEGCLGWYILMSGLINLVTPISLEVDPVPSADQLIRWVGGGRRVEGSVISQLNENGALSCSRQGSKLMRRCSHGR